MIINRKKNAINGTIFGILLKIIQILFPFFIRTIFIHTLGAEYLGLNSLFTSILRVLNLAELGVGSALIFSMYRPIVEDDSEKICQLMNLYRKLYRIIGLIVLIIGILLVPFLPNLIKGSVPSDVNLYVLYALHLSATVLSYWLFAYRNSLFAAHQRNDIISIISIITYVIIYGLQVCVLLLLKNYYAYLVLSILAQIIINISTAIVSVKFFPNYKPKGILQKEERFEIYKKVRDLFTAKVGGVINNSVDSIVISAILGLEVLAIYQNYYYIISAIMAVFSIFFAACTAGIGNSLIVNSSTKNRTLLYNINHISFWAINYSCTCFISLCQPFMHLWIGGKKLELDFPFVILFSIYLFAEEAPRLLMVFKDAAGVWKYDRFRPLISAGANLVLNLILTPIIGLYGIIISTIVSLMFISYPWLIFNIDKRLFRINKKKYVLRVFLYLLTIICSSCISYAISSFIMFNSDIITLIIRFVICTIISNIIFLAFFYKTEENKYMLSQVEHFKNKYLRKRGK